MHARENDGDEKWVIVAGILDCEVVSDLSLYETKQYDGDWRVIQKYTAYVLNTDRPTNCWTIFGHPAMINRRRFRPWKIAHWPSSLFSSARWRSI